MTALYYNHDHGTDEDQYRVLRSVGVTPEGTPEIWEMFMEIRRPGDGKPGLGI